ncbi:MAG: hypothetical protein R2799_16590 [Crocinitomicaceae bacterium]
MAKKVSKSNENLSIEEVAEIFSFREKSLKLLFSDRNPNFLIDFVGLSQNEVRNELKNQLEEIEKDACLNILAVIEARFRLDYIIRCEGKHKEEISRKFRELFSEFQYRISLEDKILKEWKETPEVDSTIISNIKGAFKYRHWLAHGRYWTYKAPKYDFFGLYNLAIQLNTIPLKN